MRLSGLDSKACLLAEGLRHGSGRRVILVIARAVRSTPPGNPDALDLRSAGRWATPASTHTLDF
jgi:hypothetical protein